MLLGVNISFILGIWVILGFVAANTKCDNLILGKSDMAVISNVLTFAGKLLDATKMRINHKQSLKSSCVDDGIVCEKPMDCAEVYQKCKKRKSGIYDVWPRNRLFKSSIKVYCDMEDDGGGWTIIQRRGDFDSPENYFYRDWATYKRGFGNLMKDFWLGNDIIFALTNQRENLVKFTLRDWEKNTTYAIYEEFWMDDVNNDYTMHVKGYRGTAGDSFGDTNGAPFSTKDVDKTENGEECAVKYKGAWWYVNCHFSNLNGYYLRGSHKSYADGVEWKTFRGYNYSLMDTVIKIRPTEFQKTALKDVNPL